MTISPSFVLLLAILSWDAVVAACKTAVSLKPDNCKDDEDCTVAWTAKEGSTTLYWCEWADMEIKFKNQEWKQVKHLQCDSAGSYRVTIPNGLYSYGNAIPYKKDLEYVSMDISDVKELNCKEKKACTLQESEIDKCIQNDCKKAVLRKDSINFYECDDTKYQLETFDNTLKLWIESDILYCVENTIFGLGNSRYKQPFRCRKKRDNICNHEEYFNDNMCPNSAICVKPDSKGTCSSGKLQFLSKDDRWIDADNKLSCGRKNANQWMFENIPIASPLWVACVVNEKCTVSFDKVDSPFQKPDLQSDTHTLKCAADYELEAKDAAWHYVDHGRCFGGSIFALDNPDGRPKPGQQYTTARCRRKRDCNVPSQYFGGTCDMRLLCEQPKVDFQCNTGYIKQFESDDKWAAVNSIQCSNNQAKVAEVKNEFLDIVPNHIRCMKEKLCDLQYFFTQNECDDKLICTKPEQLANKDLKCDNEYGLQAKFDKKWEDVKSASCVLNSFQVIDKIGAKIGSDKYAIAFRCVQMNIDELFDNSGCKLQDCKKPSGCSEMKCEDQWGLLILMDEKWKEVHSASCNAGTLRGKFAKNGEEFDEPSVKVKCAREKCAQCKTPCPTCTGVEFTDAKKWNKCTEFSCGSNARTILSSKPYDQKVKLTCLDVEKDGTTKWKVDFQRHMTTPTKNDVKCEKSCTVINPLHSKCAQNDKFCDKITLNDDTAVACSWDTKKMFYDDGRAGPVKILNLQCNKASGLWTAKDETGNEVIVPKDSNVYCHHGCNYEPYYEDPDYCGVDNHCETLNDFLSHPGQCKDDHGLQIDFGSQSPSGWIDVQSVNCDKHRFIAKNDKDIDAFPYGIRCIRKNLPELYDKNMCERAAKCSLPTSCAPIKCDAVMSTLHVQSDSKWIEDVDSARCDSDKVTYSINGDAAIMVANNPKVKCVRMKCTYCDKNPCPNCPSELNAKFAESTKWNECAKFECGEHTRTTFVSKSSISKAKNFENAKLECVEESIWKVVGEDVTGEEVMCEKLCTLANQLDNKCDPKDLHCVEVKLDNDDPLVCSKKLFFADDKNQMVQISELSCDKREGVWMTKIDGKTEKTVLKGGSKLYCHFGCDITMYFDGNNCADKSECKEPKLLPDAPCEKDFGLQAKFDDAAPGEWIDILKITCVNHHFEVFGHDNKRIDKFPHDFRCIQKTIQKYFEVGDCEDGKVCAQPENCASITCKDKDQWALQISFSSAAPFQWEVIDSLRCDSDHFKSANFKDAKKDVTTIRCVQHKCTQCKNPCETCLTDPNFPTAKFTKSTKWDECSTFTCGEKTRTIFDDDADGALKGVTLVCNSIETSTTKWDGGDTVNEAKHVHCENSCELHHRIASVCASHDLCHMWEPDDDGNHKCDYQMFYKSPQSGLIPIHAIHCERMTGIWMVTGENQVKAPAPKDITLSCHAGCKISYYSPPCDAENDCKEPIKSADERYSCNEDFGLQVDFGADQTPSGWQDVSHVICEKYRFKVYNKDNSEISAFPNKIRCIRKKLAHFNKDCDRQKEYCGRPTNCTNLQCDTQFALQVEFDSNKFVEVEWATCNSHEFTIKEANKEPSRESQPTGIRCIRRKCTYCTNPCPDCHPNSTAKFNESLNWSDCAKFTCGPNADVVLHENSKTEKLNATLTCSHKENVKQVWSANGKAYEISNKITCENSCDMKSPLRSKCDNNTACETLPPSVYECSKKMFFVPDGGDDGKPIEIYKLKCKKDEGIWEAMQAIDESPVIVPKNSNIYCHAGDCDATRIFPQCEGDGEECADFLREGNLFYCSGAYTFWTRYSEGDEWKKTDAKNLWCIAGSIVNGEKKEVYEFQATCRIPPVHKQVSTSQTALYFFVVTLLLVATVIVIAAVLLRFTGYGWLHTIMLRRIRANKKKRDRRKRKGGLRKPRTPRSTPMPSSAPISDQPTPKKTRTRGSSSVSRTDPVTSSEPKSKINDDRTPKASSI